MRIGRAHTPWMLMFFGTVLAAAPLVHGQDTTTTVPPAPTTAPTDSIPVSPAPAAPDPMQTPTPAAAPASDPASAATVAPAAPATMPAETAATPAATKAVAVKTAAVKTPKAPKAPKPAKAVYSGPTEVIKLPPTPLLDEEGKQILDPDGNPMFNAPVVQKRDKHGHPVFDASGKPVFQTETDKGFDPKGKRIPVVKLKASKSVPVVISRGTFTVDGMIGKAELNYTIPNFKYLYFYVPGVGVAVVSNTPFQGATVQKKAFKGNTLTVTVEDHVLQLGSDKPIVGKRAQGDPAFVQVDRGFTLPSKFPVVGYGTINRAPYNWPGSKRNAQIAGIITPPATPKNLLPVQLLDKCDTGMMRKPTPPTLPGETAPYQPCVPITKALQREEAADEAKGTVTTPSVDAAAPATATDASTAVSTGETPAAPGAITPPATDAQPATPVSRPPAAASADPAAAPAVDSTPTPTPAPASTPPLM